MDEGLAVEINEANFAHILHAMRLFLVRIQTKQSFGYALSQQEFDLVYIKLIEALWWWNEAEEKINTAAAGTPSCLSSSIGRAPVSKIGGCEFESRLIRQTMKEMYD